MKMFAMAAAVLLASTAAARGEVVYSYAFADATTDGASVLVVSPVSAASIEATPDTLAAAMKARVATERPNRTVRTVEARIFATYREAADDRDRLVEKAKAGGTDLDLLVSSGGASAGSVMPPVNGNAGGASPVAGGGAAPPAASAATGWPFTTAEAKQRQLAAAAAYTLNVEMKAAGRDFVLIPPGEFVMGSEATEAGRRKDEQPHKVRITEPFYLARDDERIEQRWGYKDVVTWINNLQAQAPAGFAFRLPTEAEWEYAARAGKATPYYTGDEVYGALHNGMQAQQSQLAVIKYGCSPSAPDACKKELLVRFTDLVDDVPDYYFVDGVRYGANERQIWDSSKYKGRQFQPNPWGLFDVYGRYRELTSDFYAPYPGDGSVAVNPQQKYGEMRVVRGGSYRSKPEELRSAARQQAKPEHLDSIGHNDTGIRLVLVKLPD